MESVQGKFRNLSLTEPEVDISSDDASAENIIEKMTSKNFKQSEIESRVYCHWIIKRKNPYKGIIRSIRAPPHPYALKLAATMDKRTYETINHKNLLSMDLDHYPVLCASTVWLCKNPTQLSDEQRYLLVEKWIQPRQSDDDLSSLSDICSEYLQDWQQKQCTSLARELHNISESIKKEKQHTLGDTTNGIGGEYLTFYNLVEVITSGAFSSNPIVIKAACRRIPQAVVCLAKLWDSEIAIAAMSYFSDISLDF